MSFTTTGLPARARRRRVAWALALVLALSFLASLPAQLAAAATCPCTIFSATQTPTTASDPDNVPVELGVKFRSDQAGFVTGIRFYKSTANTGTHTGSVWDSAGTRLAMVTFTSETASGWQQATFASPVAVTAGTTYVASYYAPNGHYAADAGYFANNGVVNSPLTALQNGVDGGNGVYRYGSAGGFPNSTYQSTNYWVDVLFDTNGVDTTKPTVIDRQPAAGATGVATTGTKVTAVFSEDVDQTTIVMSLAAGGTTVASSTAYDGASRTVTLTPTAALTASTVYTVNLSGARDTAGNQMDPITWTFTTASGTSACPCTIWPDSTVPATPSTADSSAVEVGMKFRSSQAGYITGIRFYKGTGNTGTHLGSLWSRTGTQLASVAFTGESATGWQNATFGAPVAVNANTTYVASYNAPVGRYANNGSYFASAATTRAPLTALRNGTDGGNGVYRYGGSAFPNSTFQSTNYWVDVIFNTTATDTVPPTLVAQTPAANATNVPVGGAVSATFSENVTASSITMELRKKSDPSSLVSATSAYNSATRTATLTPSAALDTSTTYTATVKNAADPAGNTMSPVTWDFTTAAPAPPPPDQGPGGPIAILTSSANPYSKYLAEILRTEGLNEFTNVDISKIGSASDLSAYDVVVLGAVPLTAAQVTALSDWVTLGGNLIALKPDSSLANLLGITATGGNPLSDAYLQVDNASAPGAGIVSTTIQFHGPADLYTLSGAQAVATLYSSAGATTGAGPAVTLKSVGTNGGEAAAFTFDLPRSIVAMRQGNQAWAGQERDAQSPIRSDDMFIHDNTHPDWVDFNNVAIPQADEQQRLLGNLIQVMNRDKKPLPRFWYFPNSLKAVVIGTGDDHGNGGTVGRFDQMNANSPAGCSSPNPSPQLLASWTCLRYSSYVYPNTPGLSDSAAAGYTSQGFEVGVHETTNCANFTASSLPVSYANDVSAWQANYPSLKNTPPVSNRTHCIAFSDWSTQPKTELANGMRLDGNYYYWPGSWIQDRPGLMTGSGMPMRFADTDGTMIDVYQAPSQMTDESDQTYPQTVDTLLDNAVGQLGYYGAFNANMHTDLPTEPQSDALISSAHSRNVPIVSGRQMVTWLDGRNGSSYSDLSWSNNTLSFTVKAGVGATGLTGMLPTAGPGGTLLTGITSGQSSVTYTLSTIKGIEYASFAAVGGTYAATYAPPRAQMAISSLAVDSGAPTADQVATMSWTTNAVSTSEVAVGTTASALTNKVSVKDATRKHAIVARLLLPGTKYYYRVTSTDLKGQSVSYPSTGQAPATFTTPAIDRLLPRLTAARVTPLPGGIATVRWTTDKPSTAVVQVGTSKDEMKEVARADELSTKHALVLSGLEPNKTYYVRGISTDAADNHATSGTLQFITPAWGVTDQGTPSFRRGTLSGDATIDETADLGRVTLSGPTSQSRSGTYVSVPLDAQQMVVWDRAIWDRTMPLGASGSLVVRTGSTATPDSTWSAWQRVTADGRVPGSSRYIQYRVQMSSPVGVAAPSLWAMGFSHNGDAPAHDVEGG